MGDVGSDWRFTAGEVLRLVALTRADAIGVDADPVCLTARLSHDRRAGSADGPGMFAIARWWDVHDAAWTVLEERARRMLVARARGFGELELAGMFEVSVVTVHRTVRRSLELVLEQLGGAAEPLRALSVPSACLNCGQRPRARVRETRRRKPGGGWRVRPEHQSALCLVCTPPNRRSRLVK